MRWRCMGEETSDARKPIAPQRKGSCRRRRLRGRTLPLASSPAPLKIYAAAGGDGRGVEDAVPYGWARDGRCGTHITQSQAAAEWRTGDGAPYEGLRASNLYAGQPPTPVTGRPPRPTTQREVSHCQRAQPAALSAGTAWAISIALTNAAGAGILVGEREVVL